MNMQHSFPHCSKDWQITRNKNALWLSQSIGACCQFPEEGEETGSCFSSPSQAGLIENQITVLDTKAALGPWQELGSTAQRSRCLLGPPQNSGGVGPQPLCPAPSPSDLLPLSFLTRQFLKGEVLIIFDHRYCSRENAFNATNYHNIWCTAYT